MKRSFSSLGDGSLKEIMTRRFPFGWAVVGSGKAGNQTTVGCESPTETCTISLFMLKRISPVINLFG